MKQFLTSEQVEILNKVIKFALPPRVVSLGDLLEILPETIYHEGKEYSRTITKSIVQYCCEEEGECLEITDEYENCQELIDNLFHTCLSLKDTDLLNVDNSSGYKFEKNLTITKNNNDIPGYPIVSLSQLDIDDKIKDIRNNSIATVEKIDSNCCTCLFDYGRFELFINDLVNFELISKGQLNKHYDKSVSSDKEEDIFDSGILDTSGLLSHEELCEITVKQPKEVSEGIYILPENFLNTTEEDYKKIKGKCFIRELGGFIVVRVEDLISPQYPEFLYEQYDQYNDGSWNCKDYNWLQKTAVYDPEYRKYCLTDQTDMNVGSEEMYCLGKDGNLYVTLECGDEWLRFIPIDSDKFEKIKEEALRNFEEENGYDL